MVGKSKLDRRGSGPWFFVALVLVLFALYSLAVAASTADECGDRGMSWKFFPPQWECDAPVGFG